MVDGGLLMVDGFDVSAIEGGWWMVQDGWWVVDGWVVSGEM